MVFNQIDDKLSLIFIIQLLFSTRQKLLDSLRDV